MPCDRKNYPSNWLTEIRPLILRRAGWNPEEGKNARCEFCDVTNYSYRMARWSKPPRMTRIVLTIAHLDQDTWNNDPQNLAALCQRCHLRHDRAHHAINASLTRGKKAGQSLLAIFSKKERKNAVSTNGPNHSLNVLFSPEQMIQLEELVDRTKTNMSTVIRQAVDAYHRHKVLAIPTCADNAACRVPTMFPVATQTPPKVAP